MKIIIDDKLREIGKTRHWLSLETKMSYPAIKKLCDGDTDSIKFDNIENLCRALNCEIQDIFIFENSDK